MKYLLQWRLYGYYDGDSFEEELIEAETMPEAIDKSIASMGEAGYPYDPAARNSASHIGNCLLLAIVDDVDIGAIAMERYDKYQREQYRLTEIARAEAARLAAIESEQREKAELERLAAKHGLALVAK